MPSNHEYHAMIHNRPIITDCSKLKSDPSHREGLCVYTGQGSQVSKAVCQAISKNLTNRLKHHARDITLPCKEGGGGRTQLEPHTGGTEHPKTNSACDFRNKGNSIPYMSLSRQQREKKRPSELAPNIPGPKRDMIEPARRCVQCVSHGSFA